MEVLSSSTQRVMVAISSLSPEELDATFPEKKSKVVFIQTVGSSGFVAVVVVQFICFCSVDCITYICIKYCLKYFFSVFYISFIDSYLSINTCFSL